MDGTGTSFVRNAFLFNIYLDVEVQGGALASSFKVALMTKQAPLTSSLVSHAQEFHPRPPRPITLAMSSAPTPPGWISPTGKSGARERYSFGRRLLNEDGTVFDPFEVDLPSPPRSRGSSPIANKMAPHANDRDPVTGRKKLKTSDLPLTSAQRGAVEGLAHTFKKKGGYDSLRKSVWEDLEKSVGLFLLMFLGAWER